MFLILERHEKLYQDFNLIQDTPPVPYITCSTCARYFTDLLSGQRQFLPLTIPMHWREQKNHVEDIFVL